MKSLLLPVLLLPLMAVAAPADGAQTEAAPQDAVQAVSSAVVGPAVLLPRWEIKAGASVRSSLDRWCERAGYRLVWNIDNGYRAQGDLLIEGDFIKAVTELFGAIQQDLHLRVQITKNKLVLVGKGDK